MIVYILWHVGHQNEAGPNGETVHREEGGFLRIDVQDGDDVKLLGVYSAEAKAEQRQEQAKLLPGFRDEPDCFDLIGYELDEDMWTDGFVRIPPGE